MDLGSLIGYLGLDTSGLEKGLDKAATGVADFAKQGESAAEAAAKAIGQALDFADVSDKADTAAGKLVASWGDGATQAANALHRVVRSVDETGASIAVVLDRTSGEIVSSFKGTADDVDRALSRVGGGAFTELPGQAQAAGKEASEKVANGFGKAVVVAKVAAVGLAAGAALTAGITGAMDVEAANDKLAAQLGASGEWAEELGSIAGSLYAGAYGDSLEQVNEALRGVMQNGAVMEDASSGQIEAVTAKVLDLATAFDADLGSATRAAGQMVRTGMAVDAEQALDIITRGMEQGGDKAQDFLDVLDEYAGTFATAGFDAASASGIIVQGLGAGARSADEVADAVREMGIRIKDASAAEAIENLGLNFEDVQRRFAQGGPAAAGALDEVLDALRAVEDPATQAALAMELGGGMAENMAAAFLKLDPSAAVDSLGQIEGAAGKMGQTLNDNAATNIESFKRQATQAFVTVLGGQVLPVVSQVAAFLASNFGPALSDVGGFITGTLLPALQSLGQFILDNQTPIMIVAGLIAAVFLPHLIALGVQSLIAGAKTVAGWVMTSAGATAAAVVHSAQVVRMVAGWVLLGTQSMLQGARMAAAWLIAMGPVGWVIAAVVGLVALVIANWDKVKTWTVSAWNAVVGAVTGAWRSVTGAVSSGISSAVNLVRGLPGRIVSALGNLGSLLLGAGKSVIQGFINGIKNAFGAVKDTLSGLTDLLPDWKGPAERDAVILRDAGALVMSGFEDGLISKFGDVRRTLGNFTVDLPAVADQMAALADTQALAGLADIGVTVGPATAATGAGGTTATGFADRPVVIHSTIKFTGPVYGGDAMRRIAQDAVDQRDADLARNLRSAR